jgi:hypothetical protein
MFLSGCSNVSSPETGNQFQRTATSCLCNKTPAKHAPARFSGLQVNASYMGCFNAEGPHKEDCIENQYIPKPRDHLLVHEVSQYQSKNIH